jgi:hypothetical protein
MVLVCLLILLCDCQRIKNRSLFDYFLANFLAQSSTYRSTTRFSLVICFGINSKINPILSFINEMNGMEPRSID